MEVKWTDQQLEAIETRGGNILVAAAAGSGKTAVLVERIIRMITDSKNPVSIERLLVLTFTDAAASEMKRKVSDAIDKKLAQDPDNKWLREQSIKVGSASISTIHSFCSRIITNNVHLTDLPADFSLIDDTENEVLRGAALDAVLESYYSRIDKKDGFRQLVMGWGGIKGDDSLRELVLTLHDFSRSLAYPKKWLRRTCTDSYDTIAKGGSFENTVWAEFIEKSLCDTALSIASGLKILWQIVEREVPSDHKYHTYYYDMMESFCREFEQVVSLTENRFDRIKNLICSFEIPRAPSKAGLDDVFVKRLNRIRDNVVKAGIKKAKEIIDLTGQESLTRTAKCAPVVKALCSIVRQTEKVHQRYKKERGVIDFSDLEHGLLRLICNERGEETPLCTRLREYYHEILLDEFQDTNVLQFEIFKKLSKESGNLFMVGDVKQCIYKFRNADPSIFMGLYKAYGKGDGGRLIRLFKNFRSRTQVVDSVNYVFSSVMRERLGGVDYTEEEYLINGAAYPQTEGCDTEVIITDVSELKSDDSTLEDFERGELEARCVAERIKKLVCCDKMCVTDKQTGELRDIKYGDITVLCRSGVECRMVEEALGRQGISSQSETGRNYLDSLEVTTVLCFLQIIDNPLQDIPLIAVMRSPMFKFSADELAKIRTCADGRFYTALRAAAENNKKAADFLEVLLELRACAKHMGTDELVFKICNELHYLSFVGAMPNGDLRKANLKLLMWRCSEFEKGSLRGIFNFIKYIEMLKERGRDLAPAKESAGRDEAVKIMTMHKSKGLEFPVVVLFGTARRFDARDVYRNIIWDEKMGIGLDYVDTRQRVKFKVPIRTMIEDELLAGLKAEEMRLLYVAMTRAKEKLIISAAIVPRENRWRDVEFDEDGRFYSVIADKVMCMRDWILGSLMNSPYANLLREKADRYDIIPRLDSDAAFEITFAKIGEDFEPQKVLDNEQAEDDENTQDIKERLDYVYPYAHLCKLPIKLSVSELKRRRMPDEDYSQGLLKMQKSISQERDEINAAERGVITHYVLQHIDISKTDTKEQVEKQIEDMILRGVISEVQGSIVDRKAIYEFFASDLGKRLKAAKRVEREFDFYMLVPPKEVDAAISTDGADDVILQGIADCLFFEDDGIVLIDYKTDRVSQSGAENRSSVYKLQIDYYAQGIAEIFKIPVKEKYLYFLNCGENVKM